MYSATIISEYYSIDYTLLYIKQEPKDVVLDSS
nr:MAG TPA: hypothetical protein [Caudoviricetes sp.]